MTIVRRGVGWYEFNTTTGEAIRILALEREAITLQSVTVPKKLTSESMMIKSIVSKVMKMAVVLSAVTSKHGNFEPLRAPKVP